MLLFRTVLNSILIGFIVTYLCRIIKDFIVRAHKYRKEHKMNFKDAFGIRLINFIASFLFLSLCIFGLYYADKFGMFICDNADSLAVTYSFSDWMIGLLSISYFVAGRLIIVASSIFILIAVATICVAFDTYLICPALVDEKEELDYDEEIEEDVDEE